MKYERMTQKDESLCTNCEGVAYCRSDCKSQQYLERLVILENKIECGTLVDTITMVNMENSAYGRGYSAGREYQTKIIFDGIFSKLMEAFPTQSFIDAPCKTEERLWSMLKAIRENCLEENNDGQKHT